MFGYSFSWILVNNCVTFLATVLFGDFNKFQSKSWHIYIVWGVKGNIKLLDLLQIVETVK